jgi:hypothetical protein
MDTIFDVVELVRETRAPVLTCEYALVDAEAEHRQVVAIAITEAYEAGLINGSNEEKREGQKARLLAGSSEVQEAWAKVLRARQALVDAKVAGEYQWHRYQAMLAVHKDTMRDADE